MQIVSSGFSQVSFIFFLQSFSGGISFSVIFGVEDLIDSIIGEFRMQVENWIFFFFSWYKSHFQVVGVAVVGVVDKNCVSLVDSFQRFFGWTVEHLVFGVLMFSYSGIVFFFFLSEIRFRIVPLTMVDLIWLSGFGFNLPVFLLTILLHFQAADSDEEDDQLAGKCSPSQNQQNQQLSSIRSKGAAACLQNIGKVVSYQHR